MFCKQCGNEIHDDAVVCIKCGVPTDKFEKKKESGDIIQGISTLIAIVFVVLVLIVVALCFSFIFRLGN